MPRITQPPPTSQVGRPRQAEVGHPPNDDAVPDTPREETALSVGAAFPLRPAFLLGPCPFGRLGLPTARPSGRVRPPLGKPPHVSVVCRLGRLGVKMAAAGLAPALRRLLVAVAGVPVPDL